MANYTAADVKRLRELTGSGMMDCKKALEESDGDFDKAVELLRIKGAKDVGKRAERATANGLVVAEGGTMVELNCETDFVAKSADFQELADQILQVARGPEARRPRGAEGRPRSARARWTRPSTPCPPGSARSSSSSATSRSTARWRSTCTAAPRTCRPPSACWSPTTGDDADAEAARGVAMQIAAARPRYTTRDEVPADVLDNERRIAEATAREEGKPEQALPRSSRAGSTASTRTSCCSSSRRCRTRRRPSRPCSTRPALTVTEFARFEVGQA